MTEHPLTDHQLEELASKHAFYCHERDEAQDQIDQLKIEIGTEMALRGVERVDLKQYTTLVVQTLRETLSKQALLEHGVSMEQIKASTTGSLSISIRVNARRVGAAPVTNVGEDTESPTPTHSVAPPKEKKSHHKKKLPVESFAPLAEEPEVKTGTLSSEEHAKIIDAINPLGQD